MGPVVAEHGLAEVGRTAQPLLQLVAAAHGDPRHLGGEAVDQLPFLFQQALRDQHGHGYVLVAGLFEHTVHDVHHVLPDGIAIGAHDHKALHAGVVHQLRLQADVGVPLGEVLLHRGDGFHSLLVFCHGILSCQHRPAPWDGQFFAKKRRQRIVNLFYPPWVFLSRREGNISWATRAVQGTVGGGAVRSLGRRMPRAEVLIPPGLIPQSYFSILCTQW